MNEQLEILHGFGGGNGARVRPLWTSLLEHCFATKMGIARYTTSIQAAMRSIRLIVVVNDSNTLVCFSIRFSSKASTSPWVRAVIVSWASSKSAFPLATSPANAPPPEANPTANGPPPNAAAVAPAADDPRVGYHCLNEQPAKSGSIKSSVKVLIGVSSLAHASGLCPFRTTHYRSRGFPINTP